MRKIVWLIFIVFLPCSGAWAGVLTLVTLHSPPGEYEVDGKATGRNVELARLALTRMGFETIVKIVPWKRALIMAENGAADGIIDAAYSAERSAFLYFPYEALHVEHWYLFRQKGRQDLTLDRDFSNAGNLVLGLSRGFEYGGLLQNAIEHNKFKAIQLASDNEMNIRKLAAGRFDLFAGGKMAIFELADQLGCTDKIELVSMTETGRPFLVSASKTYLAFSKRTLTRGTADAFDRVMQAMRADGTVRAINEKYATGFGND